MKNIITNLSTSKGALIVRNAFYPALFTESRISHFFYGFSRPNA